jgi:hypothetical protein
MRDDVVLGNEIMDQVIYHNRWKVNNKLFNVSTEKLTSNNKIVP